MRYFQTYSLAIETSIFPMFVRLWRLEAVRRFWRRSVNFDGRQVLPQNFLTSGLTFFFFFFLQYIPYKEYYPESDESQWFTLNGYEKQVKVLKLSKENVNPDNDFLSEESEEEEKSESCKIFKMYIPLGRKKISCTGADFQFFCVGVNFSYSLKFRKFWKNWKKFD